MMRLRQIIAELRTLREMLADMGPPHLEMTCLAAEYRLKDLAVALAALDAEPGMTLCEHVERDTRLSRYFPRAADIVAEKLIDRLMDQGAPEA
jgi:ferric-dicitrate binding protein FerR (iron transport regulator)